MGSATYLQFRDTHHSSDCYFNRSNRNKMLWQSLMLDSILVYKIFRITKDIRIYIVLTQCTGQTRGATGMSELFDSPAALDSNI